MVMLKYPTKMTRRVFFSCEIRKTLWQILSPTYLYGWLQVAAGAGGETLSQVQQGMSFPRYVDQLPFCEIFFVYLQVLSFSSEELALGYKDAIPALRTNENFTLEAANSIFAQVQDHLEVNFL